VNVLKETEMEIRYNRKWCLLKGKKGRSSVLFGTLEVNRQTENFDLILRHLQNTC